MIIGITGYMLAGKSTLAHALGAFSKEVFEERHFKTPLLEIMRAAHMPIDTQEDKIITTYIKATEEHRKAGVEITTSGYLTRRGVSQFIASDLIRSHLSTIFFTQAAMAELSNERNVIFDDVRHADEVEVIRGMGGIIIRVTRPGCVPGTHSTETQEIKEDHLFQNHGTLIELSEWALRFIRVVV